VPILNLSSSIALKLLPSTRAAMAALAGDGIQSTPIPIGRFDPPPPLGYTPSRVSAYPDWGIQSTTIL
jgi:hypothetical protein